MTVEGRKLVVEWARNRGPAWDWVPSGDAYYRLRYRREHVLRCEDCKKYVSAYVEDIPTTDVPELLRFGPSRNGHDGRGIRLAVPLERLSSLLEWCEARATGDHGDERQPDGGLRDAGLATDSPDSSSYSSCADAIYGCHCESCPVVGRTDQPGYYPKFGAGGRGDVEVAIVTMNPGAPNEEQKRWTRSTLDRTQMHWLYEDGLLAYHREYRGGGVDLRALFTGTTGLPWSKVYCTELAKCITRSSEQRIRPKVLAVCSTMYLATELDCFADTLQWILCVGNAALDGVVRQIPRSPLLRKLRSDGRILKVTHPSPLNRYSSQFRPQLEEAFGKVRDART